MKTARREGNENKNSNKNGSINNKNNNEKKRIKIKHIVSFKPPTNYGYGWEKKLVYIGDTVKQ